MSGSELTEFLLARLAEDEARATSSRVEQEQWHTIRCGYWIAEGGDPCDCNYPARVVAEVAAKRRIVEQLIAAQARASAEWGDYSEWIEGRAPRDRPVFDGPDPKVIPGLESAARFLAQPYSNHPDFDPQWRV